MEQKRIEIHLAELALKCGFQKRQTDLAYKKDDGKMYSDLGSYTDYPACRQSELQYFFRQNGIDVLVDRMPIENTLFGRQYFCLVYINNEETLETSDFWSYDTALESGLELACNWFLENRLKILNNEQRNTNGNDI